MDSIKFTFAGIDFMVEIDATIESSFGDSVIESIQGVYAWNEKKHCYEALSCDLEAFEKDLQDQIDEAFEEMYNNRRLAYEDFLYEKARDDAFEERREQELANAEKERDSRDEELIA